jgi:hypothetical protein
VNESTSDEHGITCDEFHCKIADEKAWKYGNNRVHHRREIIAIVALENGALFLVEISINFSSIYSTVFFSITVRVRLYYTKISKL